MRYAIVANPVSGGTSPARKRLLLREAANILDAKIHGLEARTPEEFRECVVRTARECDVLVGGGGDGTLSMIINAIDRAITPVGFLPIGAGNAMRHALRLVGSPATIARQIRDAPVRKFDLVDCGGKVAFSASVGIEAAVLRVRRRYSILNRSGLSGYLLAALIAYFLVYRRISGILEVDGVRSRLESLLTLLVVKHPFHGFGMRVVPQARLDDGRLHVLAVSSGFWRAIVSGGAALFASNLTGRYQNGKSVKAFFDRPHGLQADGEEWWEGRTFRFEVLDQAIMMKA